MMTSQYGPMPEKLKTLYLQIIADASDPAPICSRLFYINEMFPRQKLEDALKILIRKGITGPLFVEWFNTSCQNSGLELIRQLTRMVERERSARRLHIGDLRQ